MLIIVGGRCCRLRDYIIHYLNNYSVMLLICQYVNSEIQPKRMKINFKGLRLLNE